MHVIFTYTNGRTRRMTRTEAGVLQKLGHGRVGAPGDQLSQVSVQAPKPAAALDPLDALDDAALHALAKERGIKVHHKAGADKVRAALRAGPEAN